MQSPRQPRPLNFSPVTFKIIRLTIAMVISMAATSPPNQPNLDGGGTESRWVVEQTKDETAKKSSEDRKLGQTSDGDPTRSEGTVPDSGHDRLIPERSLLLNLPHPGFLAGQHPYLLPTFYLVYYLLQILVLSLLHFSSVPASPSSSAFIGESFLHSLIGMDLGWGEYYEADPFRVDNLEQMGLAGVVLGGMGRLWCYSEMGEMFTFQLVMKGNHKLITSGPYTYIRHPSYTSLFILFLSSLLPLFIPSRTHALAGLISSNLIAGSGLGPKWGSGLGAAMLVVFSGYFWWMMHERAGVEERALKERFGGEWEEYEKRSWRFLPWVW